MSGKYPWDFATVFGLISAKFPKIKFMKFPKFALVYNLKILIGAIIIIYDIRTVYDLLLFHCFS